MSYNEAHSKLNKKLLSHKSKVFSFSVSKDKSWETEKKILLLSMSFVSNRDKIFQKQIKGILRFSFWQFYNVKNNNYDDNLEAEKSRAPDPENWVHCP